MTGCRDIQRKTYQFGAERRVRWNEYPPFVGQSSRDDLALLSKSSSLSAGPPGSRGFDRSESPTIGVPTILRFMSVADDSEAWAALVAGQRLSYGSTVLADTVAKCRTVGPL